MEEHPWYVISFYTLVIKHHRVWEFIRGISEGGVRREFWYRRLLEEFTKSIFWCKNWCLQITPDEIPGSFRDCWPDQIEQGKRGTILRCWDNLDGPSCRNRLLKQLLEVARNLNFMKIPYLERSLAALQARLLLSWSVTQPFFPAGFKVTIVQAGFHYDFRPS